MDNKNIENRNDTQWYGKKIVKCIRKAIYCRNTSSYNMLGLFKIDYQHNKGTD